MKLALWKSPRIGAFPYSNLKVFRALITSISQVLGRLASNDVSEITSKCCLAEHHFLALGSSSRVRTRMDGCVSID